MGPEALRTVTDTALLARLDACIARTRPYIQEIGVEVRDALDAEGLPHTPDIVHATLHRKLPDIIAGSAGTLLLCIYEHEDPEQEAFDKGMAMALALFAGIVRLCFEEFGSADEAALTATVDRCQEALLVRLQSLADAVPAIGHA